MLEIFNTKKTNSILQKAIKLKSQKFYVMYELNLQKCYSKGKNHKVVDTTENK